MAKREQESSKECDDAISDDDKLYIELSSDEDSGDTSASDSASSEKVPIIELETSSASEEEDASAVASNAQDNIVWRDVTNNDVRLPTINFTTAPSGAGSQISTPCTEPIEFFQLFFSDRLLTYIVDQTNRYANQKIQEKNLTKRSTWNNWLNVNLAEMRAFIGVILNMGIIKMLNIKDYWSQRYNTKIPFFSEVFHRERFLQIFWMLHVHTSNKDGVADDRNIDSFLDYIRARFKEYFFPGREILIDESMVPFKGKVDQTSDEPKPSKCGIRVHMLVDANTGYVCTFLPYYEDITNRSLLRPDLPVTTRIVLHLYKELLDSNPHANGHHLYVDRHYANLQLAQELLKLNCHLTGMVQQNQAHVPQEIKRHKFGDSSVYACRSGEVLLLAWKERRTVTMLSTFYTSEMQTVNASITDGLVVCLTKPKVIVEYNKYMNGVNRTDQYGTTYPFLRKSFKWWKKLFFWTLQVCVVNSYILYKETLREKNKVPVTYINFVRELVDQLVGNIDPKPASCSRLPSPRSRPPAPRSRPPTFDRVERLNGKLHIMRRQDGRKSKECVVCSNRKQGARRETVYYCATCTRKPFLHIGDCFESYHTKENYKLPS